MGYVVQASGIVKNHTRGHATIPVLRGIDLSLKKGEYLAIMGASGSGKSTLLNILGCLDRPTAGRYLLNGVDVLLAGDTELSRLRANYIGFIFQTFNLIDNMTVAENITLPFLYQDADPREIKHRVHRAMTQVGLSARADHRPMELSGGEMQRVAIARALAVAPKLILADEPTGNLDSETAHEIMQLLGDLHAQGGTIVLVTHDHHIAAQAQSCIMIRDGQIVDSLQ